MRPFSTTRNPDAAPTVGSAASIGGIVASSLPATCDNRPPYAKCWCFFSDTLRRRQHQARPYVCRTRRCCSPPPHDYAWRGHVPGRSGFSGIYLPQCQIVPSQSMATFASNTPLQLAVATGRHESTAVQTSLCRLDRHLSSVRRSRAPASLPAADARYRRVANAANYQN